MSLRFRNSAVAFILLHELGRLRYGHRGYEGISSAQARQNEEDADRFALDVLQRTGTIPIGALLFFQAQTYMMPNKGRFIAEGHYRSEEDWERYLYTEVTHPLTTRRLELMALSLNKTADESGSGSESDTLRYIATRLIHIVEILEDTDLQGCMAVAASRADPSSLAPRRQRERTGSLLEKWCGSSP